MDFLNQSSSEEDDQMETMLLQMDKIPDLSAFYDDLKDTPFFQQNPNFEVIAGYEKPNVNSSEFPSPQPPPPAVLFTHHDQPAQKLPDKQSKSGGASWKGYDDSGGQVHKSNSSMAAMREMIFRIAAMQPVHIDPEAVKPPKRKNVKISTDPQSVAARHRRERISERIRILQRLVPGGTKMDTASMLDEAIHYVKFLKNQVQSLERVAAKRPAAAVGIGFPVNGNLYFADAAKQYR